MEATAYELRKHYGEGLTTQKIVQLILLAEHVKRTWS
jgi:hypothetical protein